MCRAHDRRCLLAELKAERGKLTDQQQVVIGMLRECGLAVFVWRPSDFDEIASVLR